MKKIEVAFIIEYDYLPNEKNNPCSATIEMDKKIPSILCNGKDLCSYWGFSEDNFRTKYYEVEADSWQECQKLAKAKIVELTTLLRQIAKTNRKIISEKPGTEEKKVLI